MSKYKIVPYAVVDADNPDLEEIKEFYLKNGAGLAIDYSKSIRKIDKADVFDNIFGQKNQKNLLKLFKLSARID